MSLLDEFRQEQDARKKSQCRVRAALEQMDKQDRADLEDALSDLAIQHVTITNVLRAHGHDMGKHSVATHRRGQCGCTR